MRQVLRPYANVAPRPELLAWVRGRGRVTVTVTVTVRVRVSLPSTSGSPPLYLPISPLYLPYISPGVDLSQPRDQA